MDFIFELPKTLNGHCSILDNKKEANRQKNMGKRHQESIVEGYHLVTVENVL
jgi:hypothetical protein